MALGFSYQCHHPHRFQNAHHRITLTPRSSLLVFQAFLSSNSLVGRTVASLTRLDLKYLLAPSTEIFNAASTVKNIVSAISKSDSTFAFFSPTL